MILAPLVHRHIVDDSAFLVRDGRELHLDITEIVELENSQDGNVFKVYEESLAGPPPVEATSLMSAVAAGGTELQPAFLLEGPPKAPILLQIRMEGRPPQEVTFEKEQVTIGRERDNDLVLDDPRVSRRHAQVTRDGSHYFVTDLNSANGSYLDGAQLPGGVPMLWKPHQELILGGTSLRLLNEAPSGTVMERAGAGDLTT